MKTLEIVNFMCKPFTLNLHEARPACLADFMGMGVRHKVTLSYSSTGLSTKLTDALGKITDPLNQAIINGYDNNGNLTSVTDPKGNIHKFAYDTRDANSSETNPLNVSEAYVYDAGHNLIKKTDRKGQITQYTYDNLDRLTKVTYHDASSVSYSYDKADRVTSIVGSLNGTISFVYDNHDRITKVTTPKGSVNYSYYANGLRKTLDVTNMPTLTYTYDAGDRLTRIDQAAGAINNNVAQNVRFVYDTVNRVTQVVYTNGVTRNHTYDAAGQLTAIVYKKADGVTVIGDLSYSYDANGRRTLIGGTLSNANQPAELTSSTVDAANRLTAANGQALTYDANGNLTGDGTQTYVWNARNQLSQIKNSAGTVIASFTYDALGRRQTKTVNGVSSGFVYDGANIVQELSGADNSLAANIRSSYLSVGIDQMMAQFTGSGTTAQINTYLTDALGSTISLVNAAATPLVNYTYDPYGNTTASATVNNAFQYTGRENDGNGLYYYRARYYSPKLQRFISSDPIGLSGGINTFGYVGGNPLSFIDPLGLMNLKIPGKTGETAIHANPGPDVVPPGARAEHDPPHIHLGGNDGPRVNIETWEPYSPDDERKMTSKQKKMLKDLCGSDKELIKSRQNNVFKHGKVILKALAGPMMISPYAYCQSDIGRCIDTIESLKDSINAYD